MVTKATFYTTQILSTKDQTSTIRTFHLEIPEGYSPFQPGHITYVQLDGGSPLVKPYSICSLPEEKVIELCVDRVNEQGASGRLHHYPLHTGLGISAPAGKFLLPQGLQRPLLLIGLGSGVGVLHGMMKQHYRQSSPESKAVHFYAVNTDETAIPYEAELERASELHLNLEVYPILQTNGYDTDDIADRVLSHSGVPMQWEIFLAGPIQPAHALKNHLVEIGYSAKAFHPQGYQ